MFHHSGNVVWRDFKKWDEGYWVAKGVSGTGIKAAQYVTKYATKDLLEEDGTRRPRIRASRNPTYGGPMVIRDLDLVQEIMRKRDDERLDEVWTKNLKMILREKRRKPDVQRAVLEKLVAAQQR